MKRIYSTIWLCVLSGCLLAASPTFEVGVSQEVLTIGDPFRYEIIVTHDRTVRLLDPQIEILPPIMFSDLKKSKNRREAQQVVRFLWEGRVYDTGAYIIPSQRFNYFENEQERSVLIPTINLVVNSVITTENQQLQALKPLIAARLDVPGLAFRYIKWGVGLFLVLVIGWYVWRRYFKPDTIDLPRSEPLDLRTPEERARQALAELNQAGYVQVGDVETHYLMFSGIVRHYLSDRFSESCLEMTSSEILQAMHAYMDDNSLRRLGHLFEMADLVKFACFVPQLDVHAQMVEKFEQIVAAFEVSSKDEGGATE